DVEATLNLLREAGSMNNTTNNNNNNNHYSIQLSSAYLNPTSKLLSVLRTGFKKIELLTAGKISHGFKPKNKDCNQGSKGTDWTIPSIFQRLVDDCMVSLRQQQRQSSSTSTSNTNSNTNSVMDARLYHWERPQWTFHAKGIWLREEEEVEEENDEKKKKYAINDTTIEEEYYNNSVATDTSTGLTSISYDNDNSEVAAVVVGSSNFGYRSFFRDMESNLLLVFPPSSSSKSNNDNSNDYDNATIARSFEQEWNNLLASSKRESEMTTTTMEMEIKQQQQQQQDKKEEVAAGTAEKLPPLSWPIRFIIPYIKTFF
ncbi:MAG: phosphatidylserine/phosphatidylglycerophosphate/cardiolipin synthase-like enzyme, partial [Bacillariaceae sp.]